MKKLTYLLVAVLSMALWSCSDDPKSEVVACFENELKTANTTFLATEGEPFGEYGYQVTSFKDCNNVASFSHYFASWGFGGGFTYTNTTDTTTPGYVNLSAITGQAQTGKVYLTASISNEARITNLQPDKYRFKGAYVTNSTYAYLAMHDGNDGSTPAYAKKFGADDWFKLTATGYTASDTPLGSIDFQLAKGTDVLSSWQWFDWSAIADAVYIVFTMSSSDTNEYGMVTPGYFCLDMVTFIER